MMENSYWIFMESIAMILIMVIAFFLDLFHSRRNCRLDVVALVFGPSMGSRQEDCYEYETDGFSVQGQPYVHWSLSRPARVT